MDRYRLACATGQNVHTNSVLVRRSWQRVAVWCGPVGGNEPGQWEAVRVWRVFMARQACGAAAQEQHSAYHVGPQDPLCQSSHTINQQNWCQRVSTQWRGVVKASLLLKNRKPNEGEARIRRVWEGHRAVA